MHSKPCPPHRIIQTTAPLICSPYTNIHIYIYVCIYICTQTHHVKYIRRAVCCIYIYILLPWNPACNQTFPIPQPVKVLIYEYILAYICIYVHLHASIYVYINCRHICIYLMRYVYMYICLCRHVHIYVCKYMYRPGEMQTGNRFKAYIPASPLKKPLLNPNT